MLDQEVREAVTRANSRSMPSPMSTRPWNCSPACPPASPDKDGLLPPGQHQRPDPGFATFFAVRQQINQAKGEEATGGSPRPIAAGGRP